MQRSASAAVFMCVRERGLGDSRQSRAPADAGEGRDERTEKRTKKEYCFVLLLFLCDGVATLAGRGFVAVAAAAAQGMEAGLVGTERVISLIPSSANISIVSQCDPYQYPPDTAVLISILYVLSLTFAPLPQPSKQHTSTVCHHPLTVSLPPLDQQATLPTHTPHLETIQTAPLQIPLLPYPGRNVSPPTFTEIPR